MPTHDPLELREGHPFEHLVTRDEARRIDARTTRLLDSRLRPEPESINPAADE